MQTITGQQAGLVFQFARPDRHRYGLCQINNGRETGLSGGSRFGCFVVSSIESSNRRQPFPIRYGGPFGFPPPGLKLSMASTASCNLNP